MTPITHLFQVEGMSCQHCVRGITQALQALDPQAQVQVNLASACVTVESARPRAELAEAIAQEGYSVQSA